MSDEAADSSDVSHIPPRSRCLALTPSRARGLFAVAFAIVLPYAAGGQGVMINGSSSARFIDLRPLVLDSVPFGATQPIGTLRLTPDSVLVTCVDGEAYCRFSRSGDATNLLALVQDLDVTAWGLGQGMSVHAQLRARNALGGGRQLWPQATQSFDALSAYLEMDRDVLRVRAGRQWLASNLGVFNFDGAAVRWRVTPQVAAELYGGWTLVQGLDRPITDQAISAVENIAPYGRGEMIGGDVGLRFGQAGIRAQYQREISGQRTGLYAERFALDGEVRFARALLNGALARDLATGEFNELRARLSAPLARGFSGSLEARHYTPFFSLWTIWGAFAPVGFDEGRADVQWTMPDASLSFNAYGGKRRYQSSNTGVGFLPLRTDGWRLGGSGAWRPTTPVRLQASYGRDIGFGASRSDADAAASWEPADERYSLGLRGAALQDIYEFRVGTGRVLGIGGDAELRVGPNLRAMADAMIYRHTGENKPQEANWNQVRGGIRFEWTLGTETRPMGAARLP